MKTKKRGNGLSVVKVHNTRLTAKEISSTMGRVKAAATALQQGACTFPQWVCLCTAAHVSGAIESGGVIRGQAEIIDDAKTVLTAVGNRAAINGGSEWMPPTCYASEILAIQDLVACHSRQVHEVTYGEYIRATQLARSRVLSAGGQDFHAE